MENIEALKTSSNVLGNLFYFNPVSKEMEQVINLIESGNVVLEWPYGSESELEEIFNLYKKGLSNNELLDSEYKKLFVGPHKLDAPLWMELCLS